MANFWIASLDAILCLRVTHPFHGPPQLGLTSVSFLFSFSFSFLLFLWGFVFVALWACPVGLLLMVRAPLQRAVVLDVSPFPATASRVDIAKCINAKFTGTFDV